MKFDFVLILFRSCCHELRCHKKCAEMLLTSSNCRKAQICESIQERLGISFIYFSRVHCDEIKIKRLLIKLTASDMGRMKRAYCISGWKAYGRPGSIIYLDLMKFTSEIHLMVTRCEVEALAADRTS